MSLMFRIQKQIKIDDTNYDSSSFAVYENFMISRYHSSFDLLVGLPGVINDHRYDKQSFKKMFSSVVKHII